MCSCTIRVLLITGAALELLGIALVAWDVWDARRTRINMAKPDWLYTQPEEARQQSLQATMAEVAAGNVRRRAIGVVPFACGLSVQTIANIAAL